MLNLGQNKSSPKTRNPAWVGIYASCPWVFCTVDVFKKNEYTGWQQRLPRHLLYLCSYSATESNYR